LRLCVLGSRVLLGESCKRCPPFFPVVELLNLFFFPPFFFKVLFKYSTFYPGTEPVLFFPLVPTGLLSETLPFQSFPLDGFFEPQVCDLECTYFLVNPSPSVYVRSSLARYKACLFFPPLYIPYPPPFFVLSLSPTCSLDLYPFGPQFFPTPCHGSPGTWVFPSVTFPFKLFLL